jgi:membrane protease YdiL (CAAX protease family)
MMIQRGIPIANIIQNIFWNSEQGRFRTLWRLLVELSLIVALNTGMNLVSNSGGPVLITTILRHLLYLAGGLFAFWLLARWFDRRSFADYGFHINRRWWSDLGFGLFLGAFLLSGIFLTELLAGWITITGTRVTASAFPSWVVFLIYLLRFLAVGVCEELAFRGYLLKNLSEGIKSKWFGERAAIVGAFIVSSVFFGLGHLMNPNSNWASTLNLILIGFMFGLPFLLTGELALSIGLHITWNIFEGPVYGFAVSGAQPGTRWFAILQGGPEIWTGGEFGPEAGLICILWVLIGCGLIAAWVSLRRKRLMLHLPLALYSPTKEEQPGLAPGWAG